MAKSHICFGNNTRHSKILALDFGFLNADKGEVKIKSTHPIALKI